MRQQLADTFLLLSNVSRMNGDYPASLAGASRGVGLLLESRKLHPADRKLQLALTEAYGVLGTAEVRLGKYKEGLGHFRQSAGLVEELARLEPSNTAYQHEIMLAYGHIGDVLGNPDFANLGDTAGATAAFRRAVEIAADLHKADPADQRAANDHGIALSRLAVTLPPDQLNQRLLALRQSVRILEDSVSKNPQNVNIQGFLADAYNHLGDALQAHGDRPGARRFYRESLEVSEQRLPSGVIGTAIRLTDVCRKLGEDAARMGNRDSGLFYARKALAVTDPEGVPARARSAQAQSGLTPRGFAAMGLVYARLAAANRADAEQSRQDSEEAKWWLNKSLTAWRQFQSDPSFAPPHGREMERVEAALAELKRHP
jgi:tetratricopeptide (TPR) repeat protein